MTQKIKTVTLYTDGACSYNPGPGGWGCILEFKGISKEFSGYSENTTNNQMELLAVIQGLKALKEKCDVDIFSDSAYVVNAFVNDWVYSWANNGWKTSNKKLVKNIQLWEELIQLTNYHNVSWHKVKGHSDNEKNNRCDFLATNEIAKHKKEEK